MKASINCIAIIKHYESFRSHPYLCPAGVATIGYGTTIYENGKKVRLTDPKITESEALELLILDIDKFSDDVNSLLKLTIKQWEFDALVSFAYNVGSDIDSDDIAEGLGDCTLLKLVNANIMYTDSEWKRKIAKQFYSWKYGRTKKGKTVLPGLVARRATESLLFTDNTLKFFN